MGSSLGLGLADLRESNVSSLRDSSDEESLKTRSQTFSSFQPNGEESKKGTPAKSNFLQRSDDDTPIPSAILMACVSDSEGSLLDRDEEDEEELEIDDDPEELDVSTLRSSFSLSWRNQKENKRCEMNWSVRN